MNPSNSHRGSAARHLCATFAGVAATLAVSAPASAQTAATGDTRTVSTPVYPAVCVSVPAQFKSSARSSPPSVDDTARLQNLITQCANTGKSVVLAASGSNNAFYTGQLKLTGVALVIQSGVTLYGNDSYSSAADLLDFSGKNAALMGPGVVDGRQDFISGTPRLVQARHITDFTVYNVTLKDAAKMNLYVEGGSGFTAWGVTIRTPVSVSNTDGIDIDSLTNVTVTQSSIQTGDDGIVVKTNIGAASNITVSNNKLYGTHGLSVGSQTMYGVSNVLFKNNTVDGNDLSGTYAPGNFAVRIKTDPTCGGIVQNVTYLNTCIAHSSHPILLTTHYGTCSGTAGTPQMKNIVINGVFATNSYAHATSTFKGYSASTPLDVYLAWTNLDNAGQSGDQYANIKLYQTNFTPTGTGISTSSFTATGSLPSCSF
ncbi:MAG: glycosyl hydrolase family 28 protein [Betaproteobacteria bacterium]